MKYTKFFKNSTVILVLLIGLFSCQKKGDFINEDKVGDGLHYYPTILNSSFTDTITKKSLKDLNAKPGQQIAFQLKYRSKDSIDRIELWEEIKEKGQKVMEVPYDSAFYSEIQQCDTTYLLYQIPQNTDSTAYTLTLTPKVITQRGLTKEKPVKIEVKK